MSELSVTTLKHESATSDNITLASNGNVGIGTSSPNFPLSFGANLNKTIAVYENGGASVYGIGMGGDGSAGDPYRTKVFANGFEYLSVDFLGRVTMPYQPAFFVGGTTFTASSVHYGTPYVNRGSHYSPTTGRFTAPVAGVYTFTFSLTTYDTDSHFINIHLNDALVDNNGLLYGVAYNTGSTTVILNLNVGDYVDARRRTSMSVYAAKFTGHLLG
jgi:hypothetical protein